MRFPIVLSAGLFACFGSGVLRCAAQVPIRSLTLWFWDAAKTDSVGSMPLKAVQRTIPATIPAADAAVRALLAGPLAIEVKEGLDSDYDADAVAFYQGNCSNEPKLRRLQDYYLGVRMRGSVAIVNFRSPAMCYLNSSAAAQHQIKAPIVQTLMGLKGIKEVAFAINGKVVKDWDA